MNAEQVSDQRIKISGMWNLSIVLGLGVAILACQDIIDTQINQTSEEDEFVGGIGEVALPDDQANNLPFSLEVTDIQESRCPADVQCIRFGEVVVKTQLQFTGQTQISLFDFCLGDCQEFGAGFRVADTVEVFFDDSPYLMILNEVVPFPEITEQEIEQQAVFKIITL